MRSRPATTCRNCRHLGGPGTVVPVRLDEATIAALTEKAKAEGIATRSEAIRAAVRQWTHVA
ncbi:ribbon-helix-helix domain-containing protein [Corynebacterium sp.]|uniref:ribbon-helix-helix domain-containing protein n=1 Tax=Corynebacterium sp. TaxID=1720 RepID=UPI0028A886EE|nr:ribbon-helix-helix domain-containing protein [Corynebacterium sp.]